MAIFRPLFSLLIISSIPLWGQEIEIELQPMKLGVTVEDYQEIVAKDKTYLRICTFLDNKEKVYSDGNYLTRPLLGRILFRRCSSPRLYPCSGFLW